MSVFRYVVVFLAFLLPSIALAAPATYTLLAPLGPLTGAVTLSDYLQGIIRVIVGLAGVLAVVMIVICAIQMIASPSVSQKSASKECIMNALLGLLLAIGSWIILNTINADLLRSDAQLSPLSAAPAPTIAPITEPNPVAQGCYFKYKENNSGDTRFKRSSDCPTCDRIRNQFQADTTNYTILSTCYEVKAGTPPPTPPASTPPPATTGSKCPQSGLNLCQPRAKQCNAPNCAQFAPMAAKYASGAVSKELIKAIILQETTCGLNLVGDGGRSCGPMQIGMTEANKYKSYCGVTETISCGWLTNKANFDKAVCLSTEYLKAIAASSCGSSPRNIIAGYNGGIGACAAAADCAADTNCAGTTVQRWECLYEDSAHTICNVGYTSTRNYVTGALYCIANPGF